MKSTSGKDFCRVLERNGWVFQRITASHHIYSKPGVVKIASVPVHGNHDLKHGILRKLLKLAGLSEDDL